MKTITFNDVPELLCQMSEQIENMATAIKRIENTERDKELPIRRKELCERLSVTEQTIINWEKKGKIPFMRLDGVILYDFEEVLTVMGKRKGGKA